MSAPVRLRLTLDVAVRPDVSTGEWSMLLGQALETLRPALAAGSVPVVSTSKAPENREGIREALRAQLDESVASANNGIGEIGSILAGTEPTCQCGQPRSLHRRVSVDGRVVWGECFAYGVKCGLFRAVDKVANANGGRR